MNREVDKMTINEFNGEQQVEIKKAYFNMMSRQMGRPTSEDIESRKNLEEWYEKYGKKIGATIPPREFDF